MDHKEAATMLEALPPACAQALDAHVRQLDGEALDDAAAAALAEHREHCGVCRDLIGAVEFSDRSLRGACAQPNAGFAARTMSAMRAAAPAPGNVVVLAQRSKMVSRKWIGIAAAVALIAGAAVLIVSTFAQPAMALTIHSGALTDEHGNALKSIPLNTSVTAKDNTLLRGRHKEMVSVRKGAHFKLAPIPNRPNRDPQLQLASGDLYASTSSSADPMSFACPHFEAELQSGDCFIAHEASAVPQSVMIVFEGDARVSATGGSSASAPAVLRSGQIYYCVGNADEAYAGTLDLVQAEQSLAQAAATPARDPAAQRRQYQKLVENYRADLATLESRIAQNDNETAQLRDRADRIKRYLHDHETRLRALTVPADPLKRGLDSRTNPRTWL